MKIPGYKLVKTTTDNDCDDCAFALACINPCRLPAGWHYKKQSKPPQQE